MQIGSIFFGKTAPVETKTSALRRFIATKNRVDALPPLSATAKAEFDHGVDVEHLYYSSKIEGTNLTDDQVRLIPRGLYEEGSH